MKNLRKVFSMLVAVVMGLSLAVPAFAEGEVPDTGEEAPTYKITITANDLGDHEYTAYQFFKGTLFNEGDKKVLIDAEWGDHLSTTDNFYKDLSRVLLEFKCFTVDDINKIYKATISDADVEGLSPEDAEKKKQEQIAQHINDMINNTRPKLFDKLKGYLTAEKTAEIVSRFNGPETATAKFLDSLSKMASKYFEKDEDGNIVGGTVSTVSENQNKNEENPQPNVYIIEGLAAGFYVIQETTTDTNLNDTENTAASRYMVQVVGDTEVTAKSILPELHKKIVDIENSVKHLETNCPPVYSDELDGKKNIRGEHNTASIGEDVQYELTSKVPDMTGYKNYVFRIQDTLSRGLTFNKESMKVLVRHKVFDETTKQYKVEETTLNSTNENTTDFTNTYTVLPVKEDETGYTFTIELNEFIKYSAGDEIIVRYKATVNEAAKIGTEGNPNTANLLYSNNPNVDYFPENGTNPDMPLGKTPEETVWTYLTEMDLNKFDGENTSIKLEGAEFIVEAPKDSIGTVPTFTKGEKYVPVAESEIDSEKDTVFYKLKDGKYTETVPTDENKEAYESITTKYKKIEVKNLIGVSSKLDTDGIATYITEKDGKVKITGLSGGTYTIKELKAPVGYNKLAGDMNLVVTWKVNDNGKVTWEYTLDGKKVTSLDIANNKGATLPSTGGMGTTMFVAGGVALMAVAGVLLVVKKRTAAED